MPRPDKRYIRHPRLGSQRDSEVEEPTPADSAPATEGRTSIKGRYMVVPRPSQPIPTAEMPDTPDTSPVTPSAPRVGTSSSKYDMRPTSNAVPTPEHEERVDEPVTPPLEPAAASPAADAPTEVVFDLRDTEHGFEGTYWHDRSDETPADREAR